MPWTDQALPWSGRTSTSRHTSRQGAEDAAPRAANQTVRYLAALKAHPHGLTDAEAAAYLHLERSSINARRAPLVSAGLVYADGCRLGPTGRIKNTVWKAA